MCKQVKYSQYIIHSNKDELTISQLATL